MGALDIPLSLCEAAGSADQLVCHVGTSPLRIVRAMAQHRTQWVWCVWASGLWSCSSDGAASLAEPGAVEYMDECTRMLSKQGSSPLQVQEAVHGVLAVHVRQHTATH